MSDQMTLNPTHSATSLPESAGGQLPCDLRCGQTIDLFGQEAAPASRSARREKEKAKQTSATCGRCGSALSVNPDRQLCLESKCQPLYATVGGMMWPMIPPVVFGEQVSAAIRHGWWDDVADDLEREGYATRAEIRPACSVGAPHKRDRLWFVADPSLEWAGGHGEVREQNGEPPRGGRPSDSGFEGDDVADSASEGFSLRGSAQSDRPEQVKQSERFCGNGDVADTNQPRPQGRELHPERAGERAPWADGMEWLECPDGKRRPVKSGLRLLAHGVQHRAPILHAFGNAIVSK